MAALRDLSLRYKIPIRVTALVTLTALLVTIALIMREYDEMKRGLVAHSASLGRVLARTLVAPLTHDDLWRAFEIINAPFGLLPDTDSSTAGELIIVVDSARRIYVSTDPIRFPVLSPLGTHGSDFEEIDRTIERLGAGSASSLETSRSNRIYTLTPIASDGVLLGTLVTGYSASVLLPRFLNLLRRAALVIVGVLVVLLPASWYWGHRTGKPLLQLSDAMRQVGVKVPAADDLKLYESRDEIGQLGSAFRRMLEELRKKERLERQVVSSERLAAVGRLAAGIAHEINNPLGGMLNAISTFKRHGGDTEMTDRTIALLERGLVQIKDTVAALLVEARVESHPLTVADLEDVRTLLQPEFQRKRATLHWRVDVPETLPVSSTLVRQILINLLLNAAAAVETEGQIECQVEAQGEALSLRVVNSGRHIGPERLPYLFEPFSTHKGEGHGLGLWVTYQIVQQLHGRIAATSRDGETKFMVTLPLQEPV